MAEKMTQIVNEKLEELRGAVSSPYINGLKALANYMGIGECLAAKLCKTKEIKSSRLGREVWVKKSDVEKFMERHRE